MHDDIALSWPLARWIGQASLADHAAWVPIGRGERDPQQFWLSVLGALRQTAPGSVLVRRPSGPASPARRRPGPETSPGQNHGRRPTQGSRIPGPATRSAG